MLKKIRSVICYVVCCAGTAVATDALAIETGLASYYSDRFQGRKTASGEQYDRNKLTAAHKTLPIGSQIEVVNLRNHNSVIVTINDRGPYAGNRKLDLSFAAARELGLVNVGVAPVTYNLVKAKKHNDFEKFIPSEEIFEFNQLAKADEVEEAEEETIVSETVIEPEFETVAENKVDVVASPVKAIHTKKLAEKTPTEHSKPKEVAESKQVKSKKTAKVSESQHKKANSKAEKKVVNNKKSAKTGESKHKSAAKSETKAKAHKSKKH